MKDNFRCTCPISSALDLLGDKWTLVIVKDMLLSGKQSFKEFSESEEAIATNILSSRLKKLEEFQIVTKEKLPGNKKSIFYRLTDKGLSLAPLILELTIWSYDHIREFNTEMEADDRIEHIKNNKEDFIQSIKASYKEKIAETVC